MGWFSPIKGNYPSLGQNDKTLPYDGSGSLERGMIMKVDASPAGMTVFDIADTAVGLLYIALQDASDAQAGMAGTVGFDDDAMTKGDEIAERFVGNVGELPGLPAITGLALDSDGEYETSMYKGESLPVGTQLTVKDGYLEAADDSATVVAVVTAAPASRWVNNAVAKANAKGAVRQGKNVPVIRFRPVGTVLPTVQPS